MSATPLDGSLVGSILIPYFGSKPPRNRCLESLEGRVPPGWEVLIVSDREAELDAWGPTPLRWVRFPTLRGAAEARNRGADAAQGPVLLFLDADVAVPEGFFERLSPGLPPGTLLQGIYSDAIPHQDAASEFKNLYARYNFTVRSRGRETIPAISSHCFAARRDDFIAMKGFDERIPGASVEDSELALKALDLGFTIRLERELEVVHHKRYSLTRLLATDFELCRCKVKMFLRNLPLIWDKPSYISISGCRFVEMLSVVTSVLMAPMLPLTLLLAPAWTPVVLAALLLVNAPFYSFIFSRRPVPRAIGCVFMGLLDYQAAFVGGLWGLLEYAVGRRY